MAAAGWVRILRAHAAHSTGGPRAGRAAERRGGAGVPPGAPRVPRPHVRAGRGVRLRGREPGGDRRPAAPARPSGRGAVQPSDRRQRGLSCAVWLVCRRGRPPERVLMALDVAAATVLAALHASMAFASYPGEDPGLPYARALLLVTLGIVFRATVVPSSPRRTLLLGLVASAFAVGAGHAWHVTRTAGAVPVALHDLWTALWCALAVSVATLASRVIFGLRQQVREALAARPVHAAREDRRGRHGRRLPREPRDAAAADRGQAAAARPGGRRAAAALRARGAAHQPPHAPEHRRDLRLRPHAGRRLLLRDGVPRRR